MLQHPTHNELTKDQTKSTRKGKRTDKFVLHALDSSAHGAHCSQQGRSQPPSEHLVVVLDGLQALQVEVLPESPDEGIGYLVDVLLLLRCRALCSPRLTLSHTRLSSGVSFPGNKAAAEGLFLLLLPLRSSGADAILASTTTAVVFELPPMVRSFPTIWRPISSSSNLSVAWTSAPETQTSAARRSRWKPEAR
ncbi:unnamed protein product [Musa textilis]